MKKRFLIAIGSLVLSACGSSSEHPAAPGTGGASGSSSGGTSGSSSGGSGGSTGGAAGTASGGAAGTASGGAAGTASGGAAGTASGGAAGSGGAPSCAELQNTVATTLLGAVKCNGSASVTQCDGSAVGHDACGCKVLFNENLDQQVKQANAAYGAWVNAGCGPFACGKACIEGTTGSCDASSGTCQWN